MKTETTTMSVTRRIRVAALWLLAAALAILSTAAPARAESERLKELKRRLEDLTPELLDLKEAGKVGETADGYVAAVKDEYLDDDKVADLVGDVNDDRGEIYEIIAKEEKTTKTEVAKNAAVRNFEKAEKGEYLRDESGKWKKKE